MRESVYRRWRGRGIGRLWRLALFALLVAGGLLWQGVTADGGHAIQLELRGAIGPATSDYVVSGINHASKSGAEIVVIRMDTPGGLDTAMREIIKAILASPVPVATYVAPSGSRAASAGTYILYASHVAAMAPATNLGSATPVQIGGMPGAPEERPTPGQEEGEGATEEGDGDDEADKPLRGTAMERKVVEDAVAYIRGLAELRGRNADWAERAVREAVNLTSSDALARNVVDIVAVDVADLLRQTDGRVVDVAGREVTLATAGIAVEIIEPDWRNRLLSVITDPNIAYILMLVGIYGIIYELANPGALVPGVLGGISLLLALYAFQVLPINYAGLALIMLGVAFMIAEAFMPSFGILGVGGVIAFVTGSIILLDEESLAISLPLIGGTAALSALLFIWVMSRLVRLRRKRPVTGGEELMGAVAVAEEEFTGEGRVWLHGERWFARSERPVCKDQQVRVTARDGLHLSVEPVADDATPNP